MDIVMIIGRVLFALIFISSGINHFTKSNDMVGYAQFKKVPAAKAAVLLSGVVL
ncbi:MAG: DoxX family protein, partial [Microbacteriaceae bacterium]|nr:DoxX family protein [Microbacteriaceae bacterium]NBS62022.1 DoxX family protein [Microbacteriaceae bacterium]